MTLGVQRVGATDWHAYAADAHKAVFNEIMPPEYDRIDFAVVTVDLDEKKILGYMTCRELDHESVYLKHGGAFPPAVGRQVVVRGYRMMLAELLATYKRLTTLVENTNRTYLKLALSVGWIPIGIRNFKGTVLVELFLEEKLWTP